MPLEIDTRTLGALNAEHREAVGDDPSAQGVTVQIIGTWAGTIQFEGSQDGTNWVVVPMTRTDASTGTAPVAQTTGNGVFYAPIPTRFWRARMTAYTSGTATTLVGLINLGVPLPIAIAGVPASPPNSVRHTLLNSVGVDTTSAAVDEGGTSYTNMRNKHTLQVMTGGTVATGTVLVQGSLDTTAFVNIPGANIDLAAGARQVNFEGVYRSYRAVLTGLTGTSPLVWAYLASSL